MGSKTYLPTDPEAKEFEGERIANEEIVRAHRERRDQQLPDKEPASDTPAAATKE